MRVEYLQQLFAEMADVDKLQVMTFAGVGRTPFGLRCWGAPDTPDTRDAFLDGLEVAERKTRLPVYGILCGSVDDGDLDEDDPATVYRVRDRKRIYIGVFRGTVAVVAADVGFVAPV